MSKKEPSAAQLAARKAFGEAAKKRAAEKKEKKSEVTEPTQQEPSVSELMAMIDELRKNQFFPAQNAQQYTARSVTKFSVNSKDYPDPRDRLFQEDKLKLKNFVPAWWKLEWKVGKVNYDRDSVHYTEPRFELELWRIMEDEQGAPSSKRYKVCSGMFFEDPDSFIQVANQKGIDVPEDLQKDFVDEIRYMIIRDWLVECFYPPAPTKTDRKVEQVIGNRLVEVVETNSVDPINAFAKLQSKAK